MPVADPDPRLAVARRFFETEDALAEALTHNHLASAATLTLQRRDALADLLELLPRDELLRACHAIEAYS